MPTEFSNIIEAPFAISEEDKIRLEQAIDSEELTKLALELGNIPSPAMGELQAANFVHDWLTEEGFRPRKVGATPERPNVVATYGGFGTGKNLLMAAHLDTESPMWDAQLDSYKFRPESLENPEWNNCWLEDGKFHGYPISNDRGPMACFLIATKALKKCGIELAGKLQIVATPGEIGPEPIEEAEGVGYMGKDIGASYVFHHGGVSPDYAIAAEGCDFGLTWVGCGYVVYRIRLFGEAIFTPTINHPEKASDHPNPIYKLAGVLQPLLDWSKNYEENAKYECEGGTALPKTQISSIRAGVPHAFGAGTEVCSLYLEVGLPPNQKQSEILQSLELHLRATSDLDFEIEPVVVRLGQEAKDDEVAPLVGAVNEATKLTLGEQVKRADPIYSSMWRDHNLFNMHRIPSITTGMPRWRPTPEDMAKSALIYALTAIAVCGKISSEDKLTRKSALWGETNPLDKR
ncbi:zinc-binding metallopeptidase family protein [Hirschia baltica]|uniref:Peptidase M20 n=1 Tax=Hirschia baltica (strain ATCC 49814 / DSM 5838 / IFAM 1418) TaxID=582402 RepID=C6XP34_HIRBI|nr:peptidase M20 [Hirschia baltica]ACT60214.1 conserved hypothetical protein [Hirschia baltica ATCC 49814]